MKKAITYLLPLFIGLIIVGIIVSLNFWGAKTQVESSYISYPDSLTSHFPRDFGLSNVTVSKLPFQSRKKLGYESVVLSVAENDKILKFIKEYDSTLNYDSIVHEEIFYIEIDIKDYCLKSNPNSKSAKYPFPDRIINDEFNKYELVFYEYSIGGNSDTIPEITNKIDNRWKHGYSRGIVKDSNKEYKFWLMIW